MKISILAIAACSLAVPASVQAQNSSLIFSPTNVRLSQQGAGSGASQVTFKSSTFTLNCPEDAKPSAVLSSTSDGKGNVLVDNYLLLSVTPMEDPGEAPPEKTIVNKNLCSGGQVEPGNINDCFTASYQGPASQGLLTGLNPDTFTSSGGGIIASAGGIPPIDIGKYIADDPNQVTLALVDSGGYLASSSIYLVTSCSIAGASGPAVITGNPISSTNPTPQQLTQPFTFNGNPNQEVQQVVDLSVAHSDGTLTIADGTIPNVADSAIDPLLWQPNYVKGTSFATSECLLHYGETLDAQPACKLYTVTCSVGQGDTATGAQCPRSTARNEVFEDDFDGPAFTLPDIAGTKGLPNFHQGIGYLMASEGWLGGLCLFDPASGLQDQLCPRNTLTSFAGPGIYQSRGTTNHPNSAFIAVAPVPEDHTFVSFNFCPTGKWVNRHTIKTHFSSIPPVVPPPNNNFIAAPIESITYGVSPQNELPSPEFPIPSDTVLTNPAGCPTPGEFGDRRAKPFNPGEQTITVPADGLYLVHYFATDCAGTEELRFTQDKTGAWKTGFYTRQLYVDTVPPTVASGPELNPPPALHHGTLSYTVRQHVTATYQCADDRSGVQRCGRTIYNSWVTNPPPVTATVDTSTPGTHSYNVYAWDFAGNKSQLASIDYTVVAR